MKSREIDNGEKVINVKNELSQNKNLNWLQFSSELRMMLLEILTLILTLWIRHMNM